MSSEQASGTESDWLTFLSDYGLEDHLVGVCKGVVARRAPQVRIIDVCHQVTPQNVLVGATMLAEAAPYLPVGVHLALVDPFGHAVVRGVAVRCADGSVYVAPDNGVSSLAWAVSGGVVEARALANPALWEPAPARSFRGRDVFAPVAAQLAAGTPLAEVGPGVPADSLARIEPPVPTVHGDHVHGNVRMVDHFGNLALNVRRSDLEAAGVQLGDRVELRCGGKAVEMPFTLTFGDVPGGRTVLCEDSFRAVTIAVNGGRAERVLRAGTGDAVVISRLHRAAPRPAGKLGVLVSSSPA